MNGLKDILERLKIEQLNPMQEASVEAFDKGGEDLILLSPTGSGKTVMAAEMLRYLNNELSENPNAPCSEVAYIWIAPNRLHEQSYFKMKNAFTETKELQPVIYDELDHPLTATSSQGRYFSSIGKVSTRTMP